MKNYIGIPEKDAAILIEKLNQLLATYQVYYQNLRGFHWNITGKEFFELHLKFEELYTAANLSVDEIAERILTLGGKPLHTFEDYLAVSTIQPAKNLSNAQETVSTTLSNISSILMIERGLMEAASNFGDEGTQDLMSGYIAIQEKTTWMLSAYLQ